MQDPGAAGTAFNHTSLMESSSGLKAADAQIRIAEWTPTHRSTRGKGGPVASEVEPLLFGDFSAAALSSAAISAKIKGPNGAGRAGAERYRGGLA